MLFEHLVLQNKWNYILGTGKTKHLTGFAETAAVFTAQISNSSLLLNIKSSAPIFLSLFDKLI